MHQKSSAVAFPILHHVSIDKYGLYTGNAESPGLHADFHTGVNLIVGVNGLGKTTLLNALFRCLAGPTDWDKRKLDRLAGTTATSLGSWKDPDYFAERVPDKARSALISASFNIGDADIRIARRLSNLGLVTFSVNGKAQATSEGHYQTQMASLSHLHSFRDFYLLLRYAAFYLEGRQPVVWDPTATFDVLRVLFYDAALSGRIREAADNVQKHDSLIRNITYALNPLRR